MKENPLNKLETEVQNLTVHFGDHLRRLGELVKLDQHTCNEVTRILKEQQSEDPKTVSRLISGGLLVQKSGKLEFRVPAYRAYLARILA